jgi:hypothetical protein
MPSMIHKIVFNKENIRHNLNFHKEFPYIEILSVEIKSDAAKDNVNFLLESFIQNLKLEIINLQGNPDINNFINSGKGEINYSKINRNGIKLNKVVLDISDKSLELALFIEEEHLNNDEYIVEYTILNRRINLMSPTLDFESHFKSNSNIKIFFSAKYGQGKTSFLEHYFTARKEQYEVFTIYPVNYAVSANDDIFRYIKMEILFQLFGKNIEFEKIEYTNSEVLPFYIVNKPAKVIAPFLKYIPKIGKEVKHIYDALFQLHESLLKYKISMEVDEKKEAMQFIENLYEKEGSIFEDNFYTQLIRQKLIELKQKNTRENVLVIEDLDRIDPEHIFRILNVFAAHFDSNDYRERNYNKFEFDKIILVADYNNIQHIFEHKFGPKVDFTGYINKYYSNGVFFFNNKLEVKKLISEICKFTIERNPVHAYDLELILKDFLTIDLISLRDIIQLKKITQIQDKLFPSEPKTKNIRKGAYNYYFYFKIINLLECMFTIDQIILLFETCSDYDFIDSGYKNYAPQICYALPILIEDYHIENDKDYILNYNGKELIFCVETGFGQLASYKAIDIRIGDSKFDLNQFGAKGFYSLLKLVAEKYKRVGGYNE